MAWADGEFSNTELNFIKRLARQMDLSADEWLQLEMYMDEKVREEEALRVTRRFLAQINRPVRRRQLTEIVGQLLTSDEVLSDTEREWLEDFERTVAETSQASFLVDGLKSFLRIGSGGRQGPVPAGREAEFYDFIHNRVLFRLRRRVGSQRLENVGRPEKLKKITLSAAFLAQVAYAKDDLDPQEVEVIQKALRAMWDLSESMAQAITGVATESASKGLDLYRVMEEAKAVMSLPERKRLLQGLFAVAKAEGRTSSEEIEEIRTIAYGLGFSHREFINAKIKAMGKEL
jgi:uncharacterized tellurite resistance protein B-like protein